jgi:hypothetical protein
MFDSLHQGRVGSLYLFHEFTNGVLLGLLCIRGLHQSLNCYRGYVLANEGVFWGIHMHG